VLDELLPAHAREGLQVLGKHEWRTRAAVVVDDVYAKRMRDGQV